MQHPALAEFGHRPWPLPSRRWALTMDWEDLLFLHWPVSAAALQRLLPGDVEVETFDGTAWLGVVPFRMARTRWRGAPSVPTATAFPELNVRTYVRAGGRSGVWFFSLDAASALVVTAARALFSLPYFRARMHAARDGASIAYRSERRDRRGPPARFAARWRATGPPAAPAPGTLQHFLVERYCMLVGGRDRTRCGHIAHAPWRLAAASVELEHCEMTRLLGIEPPSGAPLAFAAEPQTVVAWSLE